MVKEFNDTLHLVLKKKWYWMIQDGEKTEEYREWKNYWDKRLRDGKGGYKPYAKVCFHYGYTDRKMIFAIKGISIGKGNPNWGAPPYDVYIIKLGKKLWENPQELCLRW